MMRTTLVPHRPHKLLRRTWTDRPKAALRESAIARVHWSKPQVEARAHTQTSRNVHL